MLEHPEIAWMERTGYPSWMQEGCEEPDSVWEDEDMAYEEAREHDLFGETL